jgi:hypothetical protein
MYIIKKTKEFRILGIPLLVIFIPAAREPAHNKSCDSLRKKKKINWTPLLETVGLQYFRLVYVRRRCSK